ncbi:hypothetical protein E2C01_001588 [Portunus trituberculatus]|uniref:Uncharacterized protein n=1 Tax=Portunus trituberculatus TaxID=210409 RepID=A0A5B7CHN9_PORTR|nr:hypothetical protein [Portunus trituberculatus]
MARCTRTITSTLRYGKNADVSAAGEGIMQAKSIRACGATCIKVKPKVKAEHDEEEGRTDGARRGEAVVMRDKRDGEAGKRTQRSSQA